MERSGSRASEATAVDLVGYEKRIGGLDQAATVLAELAERIDPDLLAAAARTAPVPWAQRLGYLLELVGAADRAMPLKAHVRRCAHDTTPLLLASPDDSQAPRADDWRLRINARDRGRDLIPRDYITEWRARAPWVQDSQVEQDLVISRALVEIFSHPVLADGLAFRGGTALYKLYLMPPARYSEDIDLVADRLRTRWPG